MGHLFQAKCWAKHPSVGVHLVYYGYGNWQNQKQRLWKGKMAFLAYLFMKIMEIRRKGR